MSGDCKRRRPWTLRIVMFSGRNDRAAAAHVRIWRSLSQAHPMRCKAGASCLLLMCASAVGGRDDDASGTHVFIHCNDLSTWYDHTRRSVFVRSVPAAQRANYPYMLRHDEPEATRRTRACLAHFVRFPLVVASCACTAPVLTTQRSRLPVEGECRISAFAFLYLHSVMQALKARCGATRK